jgi:hypothetical protein
MNQKPLIARVATATLCAALLAFPVCGVATAASDAAASNDNEQLDALFEQGRRALIDEDYAKAIRIYSHLLEYPAARQDALEYLGLARERNGQLAHAAAEYQEYLRLYPDGEGAGRVRQRLAALGTARDQPREPLRAEGESARDRTRLQTFATVSQFYQRSQDFDRVDGSRVDLSTLSSDMDVATRYSGQRYDIGGQVAGFFDKDFADDGPGDDKGVSLLFLEANDRPLGLGGALGRQARSSDGVLGRFDGGVVSYQAFPKVKFNALGGLPVEFGSLDEIETNRYFYGGSVDIGTLFDHVDLNVYAINQMVESEVDRRAVGGEVRYFHPRATLFSLVDYDIWFRQLNIFDATGTLFFPNGATASVVLDYRKVPFLTTSNAVLGQGGSSIDGLRQAMSAGQLRELAEDNTGTLRFASVGGSHPLTDRFDVGGEFSVSKLTGSIPVLDDMPVVELKGTEFSYLGSVTGRNLILRGVLATFSLRYADATEQDLVGAQLDSRVPIGRAWRIGPRIRSDYRWFSGDRERVSVLPSLRIENTWIPRVTLELEAGLEWSTEFGSQGNGQDLGFFGLAGYRFDY